MNNQQIFETRPGDNLGDYQYRCPVHCVISLCLKNISIVSTYASSNEFKLS